MEINNALAIYLMDDIDEACKESENETIGISMCLGMKPNATMKVADWYNAVKDAIREIYDCSLRDGDLDIRVLDSCGYDGQAFHLHITGDYVRYIKKTEMKIGGKHDRRHQDR